MLHIILLLCLLGSCVGYKSYEDVIPNGNHVPHPCKVNYLWKGVGHTNPLGGGTRNPFGTDFAQNGKVWSRSLCQKDSDGDGLTNGEELGDPSCVWRRGTIPARTTGLSHPGVCEPMASPKCRKQNFNIECNLQDFECDGIKTSDVQKLKLAFPKDSAVPSTETNYYCMMFDLPTDQDYHIIATKPVLDNQQVIHHMILYGCPEKVLQQNPNMISGMTTRAKPCGMIANLGCGALGGWTVGSPGECWASEPYGIRMGRYRPSKAILEVHWNNPELRNDYTDGSGLEIFFTPKLRQYDRGDLMIGSLSIFIPPNKPHVELVGTCPAKCTKSWTPINIVATNNHMHYLGKSAYIEHWRNNTKINDLATDEEFSYDSPVTHIIKPPVKLLPGDELKMRCVFTSTSRPTPTYYGEGTSDEMCFGFLSFYPANDNIQSCLATGYVPICQDSGIDNIMGCQNLWEYVEGKFKNDSDIIWNACDGKNCTKLCRYVLTNIYKDQQCLRNGYREFLDESLPKLIPQVHIVQELIRRMRTCDLEIMDTLYDDPALFTTTTASTTPGQCFLSAKGSSLDVSLIVHTTLIFLLIFTL